MDCMVTLRLAISFPAYAVFFSSSLVFLCAREVAQCNTLRVHLRKQNRSLWTNASCFVRRHLQPNFQPNHYVQLSRLKSQHGRVRRCCDKCNYWWTSTWLQLKEAAPQYILTVQIWPKFCRGTSTLKFGIRLTSFYWKFQKAAFSNTFF